MITAGKLRTFALENQHRVFSVKETSRGLVPDYVRSINQNLGRKHALVAYADVVIIYDRAMVADGNCLAASAVYRYPVEIKLCKFLFGLGAGTGCYYSGLLAEAFRILPQFDEKTLWFLVSRVKDEQKRFLKEYYPDMEQRLIAAKKREWLLEVQKPSLLKLQS